MLKITPKDKRLLKSFKVREYLRKIEGPLTPAVPQIQQAAQDAMVYGTGAVKVTNGKAVRIEPREVVKEGFADMCRSYTRTPLDPKKEAFSALAALKRRVQGTPHQDQRAWDVLAHVVADYLAQGKRDCGMWIEVRHVTRATPTFWTYVLHRRNGKGRMVSCWYKSRSACVWMAKRTAKSLGIEYREGKA